MYKIIACDMDQTLLDSNHNISKTDRETINNATSLGVKFVMASGRGFMSLQNSANDLNIKDKENEYIISFNGGAITENKNNRLLYFKGLSFDLAKRLFEIGLKLDVCIHVYLIDRTYLYRVTQNEKEYLSHMEYLLLEDGNIDFLKHEKIAKVLFCNPDTKYLEEIREQLHEFDKDISFSYSSNRYLEFNPIGVDKGNGLEQLAKLLNVDIKDTIAIGDNFNDLPMLLKAGLACGVANSNEGIIPHLDYLCENDNDHSAVSEIINKFVLNKNNH